MESFLDQFDGDEGRFAKLVNDAITDLAQNATLRTSARSHLERYIEEHHMKIGPEPTESIAIFKNMMETCREALTILDILENVHKHKKSLRVATRMLNEATKTKPQVTENEVEFLMKSTMEKFDKYFDEHQNFIRDGNCHLIFNLSTSPPIMDDKSRWIDNLLDEDVLQKEGGEPLIDVTKDQKKHMKRL